MKRTHVPMLLAGAVLLASTVSAQQRDYTGLFGKFHALGLPDVTGATYVHITVYGGGYHNPLANLHELRLSGNGWLMKENKEGASRAVADNCSVVDLWDHKVLAKKQQERMKELLEKYKDDPVPQIRASRELQQEAMKGGQWKKIDLAKDVEKAVAYMEKQKEKPGEQSWAFNSGGYGAMFLFAVHISKHGYKAEANKIIELLFAHADDRRKVIMQVINSIADTAYAETYADFREKNDWKAFDKALDDLLAKFAMGWKMAPAVKRLSAAVKKRVASPKPPPLEAEGLTEEDGALAAELATTTGQYMAGLLFRVPGGNLWILSPAEIPKGMKPADVHVIDRIMARGMKSVPLLLALLRDEHLTEMDLRESSGYGYSPHRFHHSWEDAPIDAQRLNQLYNQMARPATRADVAARLLHPLLLQDQRGRRHVDISDREGLYQECKEWYDNHGRKTTIELARLYMEKGGHGQRNAGMQVLINIGGEEDMAAIEDHFLQSQRTSSETWQVRQYVTARGEKAKAFVDRYEAVMKQRMASTDDQLFKRDNMKKQMEANIKALRDLVTVEPAGKIIEEILAGKRKLSESGELLQRCLRREEPDRMLTMLLEAALEAKDTKLARSFVQWSSQARHMRVEHTTFGFVTSAGGTAKQVTLEPKVHAEQWKKLLADNRKIDQPAYSGYKLHSTLANTAAWAIENLYRDPNTARLYSGRDHFQLGRRLAEVIRARALARLEGKPEADIPQFPSADNLSSEQKTNLVTRLAAVPAAGLDAALAALTLDEMLVLVTDPSAKNRLNSKLAPKAMTVNKISEHPEAGNSLRDCRDMQGKRLTKTMVEKIVGICKDRAGDGKVVSCSIARLACLDGIEIHLREMDRESEEYKEVTRHNAFGGHSGRATHTGTLSVTVGAPDINAHAVWRLSSQVRKGHASPVKKDEDDLVFDEIEAELDKDVARTTELIHREFWDKLDKYLSGEGNVCQAGTIQILGVPVIQDKAEESTEKAARPVGAVPAGMMTRQQLEMMRKGMR